MKRISLLVILALLIPNVAITAESSIKNLSDGTYQAVMETDGVPGRTLTVYVDNTARTIQSLYERAGGTWDNASRVPISMLFTCETNSIRMAFGGTTPTASLNGHVFPANSSWTRKGRFWMSTGKFIATGASDNNACPMTPVY